MLLRGYLCGCGGCGIGVRFAFGRIGGAVLVGRVIGASAAAVAKQAERHNNAEEHKISDVVELVPYDRGDNNDNGARDRKAGQGKALDGV